MMVNYLQLINEDASWIVMLFSLQQRDHVCVNHDDVASFRCRPRLRLRQSGYPRASHMQVLVKALGPGRNYCSMLYTLELLTRAVCPV